jgi:hypothetical protein
VHLNNTKLYEWEVFTWKTMKYVKIARKI